MVHVAPGRTMFERIFQGSAASRPPTPAPPATQLRPFHVVLTPFSPEFHREYGWFSSHFGPYFGRNFRQCDLLNPGQNPKKFGFLVPVGSPKKWPFDLKPSLTRPVSPGAQLWFSGRKVGFWGLGAGGRPKSAKMEGQNPAQVGFSKSRPFFVRVGDFSTGNDFMRICCARDLVRTQISMRTEGRKVHLFFFFFFFFFIRGKDFCTMGGGKIFSRWRLVNKFTQQP